MRILPKLAKLKEIDKSVRLFSAMIFFFLLANAMMFFVAPPLLINRGRNIAEIGLLFSFSAGLGVLLTPMSLKLFRRLKLVVIMVLMYVMIVLSAIILMFGSGILELVVLAIFWGLYYNLYVYIRYEIVRTCFSESTNVMIITMLSFIGSTASIFAPLIVVAMTLISNVFPLIVVIFFTAISAICAAYILLLHKRKTSMSEVTEKMEGLEVKKTSLLKDGDAIRKLVKIIAPVALLYLLLITMDSVFCTLGPVFWNSNEGDPKNALFLSIYNLPEIFLVVLLPGIVAKFGKKRTALLASFGYFFLAAILFLITDNYVVTMICVFLGSAFGVFTFPAVNGAFLDYSRELGGHYSKNLETIVIYIENIAYFFGPMIAGFIANSTNNATAVSLIAGVFLVLSIVLWFVTPKSINVERKLRETH